MVDSRPVLTADECSEEAGMNRVVFSGSEGFSGSGHSEM